MFLMMLVGLAMNPVPELQALRGQAVRPAATEFRWRQIPWHTDAAEALTTAQQENRPLFVWLAGGRERDGSPLERC